MLNYREQSYAVLEGTQLSLFPNKSMAAAPMAVLEVTGTAAWNGKGEEKAAEHPFAITTAKHVFFETAPTDQEKQSWIQTIEEATNYHRASEELLMTDKSAVEVGKLVEAGSQSGVPKLYGIAY
jgi:hypothetical protein